MNERPLRFCHITTFYPPYSFGGDAVYVHALTNELAQRGHHVEVIHCADSFHLLNGSASARPGENHSGVIVHRLQSRAGFLSPLATQQTGFPFFKSKAIREILARSFDVIHYHNISLVGGPGVLALGDAVKLYTAHEYWLVCPMSILFRYDGAACAKKKCLRCTLAHKRPPQWWRYTRLMQHAVRHVDKFLFFSEYSARKNQIPDVSLPYHILPSFYAPPEHASEAGSRNEPAPYFLFVGRLETLKGAHTLIPLFRDYLRARLLIAGDGTQRAALEQSAQASPNIQFLGWQSAVELEKLYRGATALIIPSLGFETGPLVLFEALCYRTPVIVRELGSLGEIVCAYRTGLTFMNEKTLRAALDTMLDNPGLREAFAANGQRAYLRAHTPEMHLARYLDLVCDLLRKKAQAT